MPTKHDFIIITVLFFIFLLVWGGRGNSWWGGASELVRDVLLSEDDFKLIER